MSTSISVKMKEPGDFTSDTLASMYERLATPTHFSEIESSACSLYEAGKKITSIGMGNAGVGAGNLYCSSSVLFSFNR